MVFVQSLLVPPKIFFKENSPATDFDGVIADHKNEALKKLNLILGTSYKTSNIKTYNQIINWAIQEGWSEDDAQMLQDEIFFNPDILYKAKPIPGAIELSKWFYESGFSLPIFTSRRDKAHVKPKKFKNIKEATLAWIQEYLPWMPEKDIHIKEVDDEYVREFKPGKINKNDIKVYFEDLPVHAEEILERTSTRVVLISNLIDVESKFGPDRLIRVKGLDGKHPDMFQACALFGIPITPNVAQY